MLHQVQRDWEQGKRGSLYLFYGTETFQMDRACDFFKEHLQKENWELVVEDLEETPIQQIIMEADSGSLFSEQKLIIGRNAYFLTGQRTKSSVTHETDSLLKYISNPNPAHMLILMVPTEKLDKRKKLVKELEKKAYVYRFDPLKGSMLANWVKQRIAFYGAKIGKQALIRFIELVGTDLRMLDAEAKKLALYAKEQEIDLEIIEELVPRTLEQDVFQLIDQISKRNREKAFQIWDDLMYQKEEPIKILALITRQIRILLQVKLYSQKGKSEKEIAKLLKLHPYPVKLAYQQGLRYQEKQLINSLKEALQTESDIKEGRLERRLGVERLLLHLLD